MSNSTDNTKPAGQKNFSSIREANAHTIKMLEKLHLDVLKSTKGVKRA